MNFQRIAVIGAGAWGTALANCTARTGRDVTLWARDPAIVAQLTSKHENPRLPGVRLDDRVAATGAIAGAAVGGPVGAAIGGVAGAVMGDVSEDALTPETRTYIMENRTESVVLDGDLAVGTVVPETATIQTVPNSTVQYVYVNDRPVVVEPETRKVIHIYE